MSLVLQRQYARDVRLEFRRPGAPRNLVFDTASRELSWTGPNGGPAYTHFNIRIGDDDTLPTYRVPAGNTRLFLPKDDRVTITCWNDVVRTESNPARIDTAGVVTWTGSSSAVFGILQSWHLEYTLTADITIESPVEAAPNKRLLMYIFQDATTIYVPSFEPADFVDSSNLHIDLSMAAVIEWAGRTDGKWYPLTLPRTFDPSI